MRQAFETKYIGPTNNKGTRISVACYAKRKIYNWQYELDVQENHLAAALKLQEELGWDKDFALIGGSLRSGNYVFLQVPKKGPKK